MFVKLLKDSKASMAVSEDRPDPLSDYLHQWGLEMYIAPFKEQTIDLETLQMLSETDVKDLVGRAKLNTQIKMLRSISSGDATNTIMEICEQPYLEQCSTLTTLFLQPAAESFVEDTVPDKENISPDTSCELFRILKETIDGKALLLRHKDTGLLNNADRRRLCNIIIANELKDNPEKKITSSRLYELAYDIPKIFKKENSSVYFIPFTTITPKQKISAKGKLLDCYRQRRRDFIKSGVISEYSKRRPSTSTTSSASPCSETTSNFQDAIEHLEFV